MPTVNINVNGQDLSAEVEERQLLVHFLRDDMDLTGTHVGCDTSQCGACVVHLEGKAVKSCTMLAVQANGKNITTIEGIADGDNLHPVQEAFRDHHGLQCGFCTPGMIMAAIDIINRKPNLDEKIVREELEGNLCRCTGYQQIIESIQAAAAIHRGESESAGAASDAHPDPNPSGPEEPTMPPGHAR